MRVAHGLRPGEENNFSFETADALVAFWKTLTRVLFAVVPAIVAIGIVVGGIVIMNIMLMSVTERTHEIGIRKAVGARARDIQRQFLAEAMTLATLGGLIGVAGGWAFAVLSRDGLAATGARDCLVRRARAHARRGRRHPVRRVSRAASRAARSRDRDARGIDDARILLAAGREHRDGHRDACARSKLRSALTILGVVIGISTVMAMATIVNGIQRADRQHDRDRRPDDVLRHEGVLADAGQSRRAAGVDAHPPGPFAS